MSTGRIEWSPVYGVKLSTDPSVQAVLKPINAGALAIAELQATLQDLIERVEHLEQAAPKQDGEASEAAKGSVS